MNDSHNELNPHVLQDEHTGLNELNKTGGEHDLANEEIFSPKERESYAEIPDQAEDGKKSKRRADDSSNARLFSRLMPSAAVFLATGAALTMPLLSPSQLELQSEYISFDLYECVLYEEDEELSLQATVKGKNGQTFTVTPTQEDGGYLITLQELLPETEYDLTVVDQKGKKRYSDTFTTEPFITLAQADQSRLSFSLHKDIPILGDFILTMLSSDGRDFGSNIVLEDPYDQTLNYLYLEGLYKDDYTLRFEYFPPEKENSVVFEKLVRLGSLTPLDYSAEMADGQIYLRYASGDLLPYTPSDIMLTNTQTEQTYYIDTLEVASNDVIATLAEQIEPGTYTVTLSGEYEGESCWLYNQIWSGELTVSQEQILQ